MKNPKQSGQQARQHGGGGDTPLKKHHGSGTVPLMEKVEQNSGSHRAMAKKGNRGGSGTTSL